MNIDERLINAQRCIDYAEEQVWEVEGDRGRAQLALLEAIAESLLALAALRYELGSND